MEQEHVPTVTKRDIARRIAAETGHAEAGIKQIVQLVLDEILESLAAGDRIELRNFGVFEVVKRKARIGRNPKTGETVQVKSKRIVVFKPGKLMRDGVQPNTRRV